MRSFLFGLASLSSIFVAAPAAAAILKVGAGQTYATPCAAVAAAQPNDEIDISVGTYTDTCSIHVAGLTLKGVGGMPKIDLSGGTPSGQKGIYVIDADNVTIENLELTGSHIDASSGENGAGIRIEAANLTVRGCYIHDNQDGILGAPPAPGGTLLIEGTEFSHNGLGNGCNSGGCTHNLYIGANVQTFTFQYNWSHDLATDTPDKGHLLKSRAQQTFVLYNRITGETDTDSYEVDIPQGGLAVIVGNLIQKPSTAGNPNMVAYAEEGANNPDKRIFVANNTFVSNKSSGTFLNITNGGVLTAHNNLFVGTATPSSTGALSADNLSGVDPLFVDQAGYDYHLKAGSPAIGMGVAPGSADSFSLVPNKQYVQPLGSMARTDGGNTIGAFQYGVTMGTTTSSSSASGTGGSASSSTTSTGGVGGAASGTGGTTDTGSSSTGTGGSSPGSKSGCSVGSDTAAASGMPVALFAALAWLARGRHRAARGRRCAPR